MKENSIEEDIKKLRESIIEEKYHIYNKDLKITLEHILSDYKRVLKENEELEEINNELEAEKNEAIRRYNFETIPKQKVKDKIEELIKEGRHYNANKIEVLQELLESE